MGISGLMKVIHEEAPEAVKEMDVEAYTGRVVSIDASMVLYQFLIAIRSNNEGGPSSVLVNSEGEQTSHIQGMFNRTIRLLSAGMRPVYVFDGKPPTMKGGELSKRTAKRAEAEVKLREARETGDVAAIEKAEGALVKVTRKDADDVKELLGLMGVPVVDAPMEAEAQCAELVKGGKADAVGTEDMDALTFGALVQLRKLTFTGKGKDQQKMVQIVHSKVLEGLGLTQAQFVDFCILCGCDYTATIRGIGPKTALKLIRQHGSIEHLLASFKSKKDRDKIPDAWLSADERQQRKAQRRKDALANKTNDDSECRLAFEPPAREESAAAIDEDPVLPNPDEQAGGAMDDEKPPDAEPSQDVDPDPLAQTAPDPEHPPDAEPEHKSQADPEYEPEYIGARELFTQHEVTPASEFDLKWSPPDEAGLRTYLVEKMGFNAERVEGALKKLLSAQAARKQQRLESFFKVLPKASDPQAVARKRAAAKAKASASAKKTKKK